MNDAIDRLLAASIRSSHLLAREDWRDAASLVTCRRHVRYGGPCRRPPAVLNSRDWRGGPARPRWRRFAHWLFIKGGMGAVLIAGLVLFGVVAGLVTRL